MAALGARQIVHEEFERSSAPELTLLEGRAREQRQAAHRRQRGPLAQVAASVNPAMIMLVAAVCFVAFVLCLRLGAQLQTSALLIESSSLSKRVAASQHAVDQLQVQHAIFSNPDRVRKIATGSLKMVETNKVATLNLAPASGGASQSEMVTYAATQASEAMTNAELTQE